MRIIPSVLGIGLGAVLMAGCSSLFGAGALIVEAEAERAVVAVTEPAVVRVTGRNVGNSRVIWSRSGSSTCQFHLLVRVEGIDRFAVRDWCTSDARTLQLRPGEERTEGITWDGRVAAPSDPVGAAAARVPIVRLAPGVYEIRAAAGAVAVSEPMLVEVLPDQ
jgi:hypothetical protein